MALVIAKHIALKSAKSIRKFTKQSGKVVDGHIINHINNQTIIIKAINRTQVIISDEMK